MVNGPEIRQSGLVVFPEVLDRFPGNLARTHLEVQGRIHQGYLKQKADGFYVDMAEQEWAEALAGDPELAANNRLVRRGGWWDNYKLRAVPYREGGFGKIFDEIANGLMAIRGAAATLPDGSLIADQARYLEIGFRTGETDQAMERFLNLRRHPKYGIWCGFLDRLLDKKRNLKFALQGWSTEQHVELSQTFNYWSKVVLRGVNRLGYSDFLFADAAIQSGLATERIWQGNTQPSQPDIADRVGYLINFFDNVSAWKTARDVEPRLRLITPEEMLDRIRRETLDKARRAFLAGHEIGHVAQVIPVGADLRLGGWFQVIKETYAEAFGDLAIIKHPEHVISRGQVMPGIYFGLARAHALIDEHVEKVTRGEIEEDIINPYSYAVATKINTLLLAGAVSRDSAGVYQIEDPNQIKEAITKYHHEEIDPIVESGSQAQAEDFIMERSSHPVDFLRPVA